MNRLLFCEPWPVSNYRYLLDQFLDGIISLFITLQFLIETHHFLSVLPFAAVFFAARFFSPFFAAGFPASFFASAFFAGALFFTPLCAPPSPPATPARKTPFP